MVRSKLSQEQELNDLIKKATEFHGHFGPFLTLGVRMGLIGLRELRVTEDETQLHVTAMLDDALPFSCMLDGLQTSTKCTVGNKRLAWKESEKLEATFELKDNKHRVRVKVNSAVVQELKRKLKKMQPSDEVVRQLGSEMASRAEEVLFSVSHK